MDLLTQIILSLCGMLVVIILDIKDHLAKEFRPAIWWRDNWMRISAAALLILVINIITGLLPGAIGEYVEFKSSMATNLWYLATAVFITSIFIVGIKKASIK